LRKITSSNSQYWQMRVAILAKLIRPLEDHAPDRVLVAVSCRPTTGTLPIRPRRTRGLRRPGRALQPEQRPHMPDPHAHADFRAAVWWHQGAERKSSVLGCAVERRFRS
jgi:hypothetical protein